MKTTIWTSLLSLLTYFNCSEPIIEINKTRDLKNANLEGEQTNKKKKILCYIYGLYPGGLNKSLFTLLNHLDYSKYELDLLVMKKTEHDFSSYQIPKEANVIYLYEPLMLSQSFKNKFIKNNLLTKEFEKRESVFFESLMKNYQNSNWLIYNQKIKNKNYDLEICPYGEAFEFFINNPFDSKKIAWVHMDLNYQRDFEPADHINYTLQNLYKTDKVITVSHQMKEALLGVATEIKNKMEVIYNPISVEEVIEKSKENIAEKKYESLQLVTIGRLAPQKGFDRLIKVCQKLKNEDQLDFHLWIVGEGPERKKLESQIKKYSLEKTVKILGFRENPYPYLKAADLFVLSSRHETMAYVILEAMILNKPIVSTNVPGPGELLKATLPQGELANAGEYGLLTQNSEEGMYEGLKKMITYKSLRDSFINKNPDFSAFETSNVIKQVEKLFDEVMSGG